uniref:Type I cytokine receptor cytokine-binding domain-containing protein n=1 Tax=Callorhinchus milii TaxID=7868 RepID=A0A4W3K4E3_CALMI|eukprot:gi/632947825/ref/XP_007889258.1/ PREDICTED: interleukin-13 receptor subunit alpha-1-like isoform X1 [Callorhinchus milii]
MHCSPFSLLATSVWLGAVSAVTNSTASPPEMGAWIPNKSWIQNVSCIFYDEIYMNCTWDISESAPQNQQFVLYYKNYNERFAKCKSQRSGDQGHASCNLHGVTSYYNILYLRINASENIQFEKEIDPPLDFNKLRPPINVTVLKNNTITWENIPFKIFEECFTYQLNFTTSNGWFTETSDWNNYNLEKKLNKFTVKVRSRIGEHHCGDSQIWSDWSESVTVEKEPEPKNTGPWMIAISIAISVSLIVLLVGIFIQRYRLWAKLCQPIPDPKKAFNGLFEDHNGDFQLWVQSNIPVPEKNEECHPITAENEDLGSKLK